LGLSPSSVGPAFQPVKTTAWKEPALSLSKGCPTTRPRAGMTDMEPFSSALISTADFKLTTLPSDDSKSVDHSEGARIAQPHLHRMFTDIAVAAERLD